MEEKQRVREESGQEGRQGKKKRKIRVIKGKMKVCVFHIFSSTHLLIATLVDFISRLLKIPLKYEWE